MNRRQTLTLWAGLAVVCLLGMFPPWTLVQTIATGTGPIQSSRSLGYAPIFSPPTTDEVTKKITLEANQVQIDTTRLAVELVFTLIIVAGLALAFKKDERKHRLPTPDQPTSH